MDTKGDVDLNPTDEPFSETKSTAERLMDSMRKELVNHPMHGRQHHSRVLHRLSLDQLMEAGGTVYVHALDVVVSIHTNRLSIHHPFSMEGTKHAMKALDFSDVSLRIAMYIVDNRRSLSDRYVNWQGRIMRVPTRQLPGTADGFYVVHPKPSKIGGVNTEYVSACMTLEEAEKEYGLYRTPEEAETYGFSKEAMERENLSMKRDMGQRQFEREETEAQRKDRLKAEQDEFNRRKQELEDKMSWRRDALDFAKFFLGTVTLVAGTAATIVKLAKK